MTTVDEGKSGMLSTRRFDREEMMQFDYSWHQHVGESIHLGLL